ncbi:MAG TPA: toll/interleukin-1 receptor domain-containing protein [Thermoanaerobaculia bacterium]|jgi:hypothetical protein
MYAYRFFLSYSSTERDLAISVADIFQELGLFVSWDHNLQPGRPFPEEIKIQIARSHLFVPLLTRDSIVRPWVHQETGFAMGVGVPILPIVVGDLVPVALIQELQALRVSNVAELRNALTEEIIKGRVEEAAEAKPANFECVELPERRAQAIARHARDAQRSGGGRIRQRGAMSSFALPDSPPSYPIWRERDGAVQRSQFLHEQLYNERMALGQLAASYGCDLVIKPEVRLEKYGPKARRIRLETLRDFLMDDKSYPDVKVMIRQHGNFGNLLIVGDFFYADSITPEDGSGYKQTLFTWHAPTVLAKIREFDSQFINAGGKSRYDVAALVELEIAAIGGAPSNSTAPADQKAPLHGR